MAAVPEYFSVGSTIWCRTCYNAEVEGEVLAFDPHTKILILKCPSIVENSCGRHDVHFLNLSLVSALEIRKEVRSIPDPPVSLNLQRLSIRIRNQIDAKRRFLQAISANVTAEGQSLFFTLAKVISEVRWSDTDIVIYNHSHEIVINPPYQLDNIRGDHTSKGYGYICKLIERHIRDRNNANQNNASASSVALSAATAVNATLPHSNLQKPTLNAS